MRKYGHKVINKNGLVWLQPIIKKRNKRLGNFIIINWGMGQKRIQQILLEIFDSMLGVILALAKFVFYIIKTVYQIITLPIRIFPFKVYYYDEEWNGEEQSAAKKKS
jgi:hypothetical protein